MLKLPRPSSLPREARDTLFLLAVIGVIVMPQVPNLPIWCSVLTGLILLWRARLALRGQPLPGRIVRITLLLAALGATALTFRTLLGRDAGVTLVVLLLAMKTLEMRARRDAFVIFFLGFFAMLTNFFYSQSLPTALAMLVALLGLLTALVNAHMPVGRPPLMLAARMAGRMALLGAPIMFALFVLFPRVAPLWGMPSDAMAGRSGLGGEMRVGSVTELALDDGIAARVKFADDRVPPQRDLYFRGPVLSRFDGREWRALPDYLASRVPANIQVQGAPIDYEVTLEPSHRPWLLTLDVTPARPEGPPDLQVRQTSELQWVSLQPVRELLRYSVRSYPQFRSGPIGFDPNLGIYTQLPPQADPRTREMAQQMRAEPGLAQDNAAFVRAALARLRTGGYSYTLEPGVYGQHTADEFWFDRKAGFCEHIASAFAVLMRSAGIPARIVTGYQGGDRNPMDGVWTLRHRDAHAWTEVWLAGQGWVRVDPTGAISPDRVGAFRRLSAPEGVFAGAVNAIDPGLMLNLRGAWEAVNNRWNQWVLNYTQGRQMDLMRKLGISAPSMQDLMVLLLSLVVLASLAGALWTLWERHRQDPWLRLLARARRQLQRAGLDTTDATTPREMAALVRQRFGDGDARAIALSDWLLQLEAQRYAPVSHGSLAMLRAQWRGLPSLA
ncbi:DUF3488 and transglutaminase-like domain-containing protein [Variovorax dokdonensis]|uniref:DUF3488 and transglutaminase-like domain-containing protein n=1 Tax=Variovorax dokdonensis TaxID=344883 RepID=A0ABT7NE29_9BURK|nr:DUF3488 and transglutaminase-like domain-containing protein [Variovorax dokdonensis]MDM0046120.1 DUF3488 and transglutaminase-like domain-containing protein [Variovorax dokdonensis]